MGLNVKRWITALAVLVSSLVAGYAALSLISAEGPRLDLADGSLVSPNEGQLGPDEPCEGTTISSGDDLAAVANESPAGTTFCISGFHRLSEEIVPKDGQRFIGVDRPVLDGSRLLTSFDQTGDSWVISDQTQDYTQAEPKIADESCMDGYEGCRYPEDVYFDDQFLRHVLSSEELEPGTFFFDYSADKIYLADDPAGHKVEANVARRAFGNYGGANNVVVRGLTIQKFSAHSGEDGAIAAFNGTGWLLEYNDIRLNHSSGVMVSQTDGMTIRRNYIHDNGCGGIMGSGATTLLIEGNEIAFNNQLNYRSYVWSCGGGKLDTADGVIFRKNYSHDNNGFGFWTDAMNVNVLYEDNRFVDNSMGGLMHEINDGTTGPTVIEDNVFRGNGFGHPNRIMFGAAIIVSASNYVEISGNLLEGNAHGITLNYTPREDFPEQDLTLHDISIHDNDIGLATGSSESSDVERVGFYTDIVGSSPPARVVFTDNRYYLGDPTDGSHFSLPDLALHYKFSTARGWKAAGYDTSSSFLLLQDFPSTS